MSELNNWNEITRGIYRYVIASKVCYEIHVLYWQHDTDVLTAKASLFLVGEWQANIDGFVYLERECLLSEQPVFECLNTAVIDNKENNNG
jgi:hypothetical protein